MSGANLSGAWLAFADLSGADLANANLSGAILDRADLASAPLSGANLSGATLNNTNLLGVTLENGSLFGACGRGATLAPGLTLNPCPDRPADESKVRCEAGDGVAGIGDDNFVIGSKGHPATNCGGRFGRFPPQVAAGSVVFRARRRLMVRGVNDGGFVAAAWLNGGCSWVTEMNARTPKSRHFRQPHFRLVVGPETNQAAGGPDDLRGNPAA